MRALIVIVSFVAFVGCTKPNPNRCCVDQADCATNNIPQGSICGDGLVCRGNQCIAEPCMASMECESMAPFCVGGLCASACTDDAQCPGAAEDPADQYCVAGQCVMCRMGANDCPSGSPVCEMNACRVCTANADCPSLLCDVDAGTCFDSSSLLYASLTAPVDGTCTLVNPCPIGHAITLAEADPTKSIKLAAGTYDATIDIPNGAVTIYGDGPATILAYGASATGATLRLRDVTIGSGAYLESISSGSAMSTLDLDRVSWTSTSSGHMNTLYVTNSTLIVRRSAFVCTGNCSDILVADWDQSSSSGSSIVNIDQTTFEGGDPIFDLGATTFAMTNSVVRNAGPTAGAFTLGISGRVPTGGKVSYSTFYNARIACPSSSAILPFDSNLILNEASGAPADTVTGSACSHSFSLIKPQSTNPGGMGNALNVDPKLVNASGGDFHLMATSPAIDAANVGDPDSHDFDGTSRPQGPANDIGAFEYH